jgi:hypothetical protein
MTATTLPRGQITQYVLDTVLATFPFPVGDNNEPIEPHGWQGEPNEEGTNFIPWISIGTGASSNSSGPQSASQADWRANYYVTTAGVARQQTDQLADTARDALAKMQRQQIMTTNGTWRIQQARVSAIGGINRLPQTRPFYFVQTDTIELWLSRELNS